MTRRPVCWQRGRRTVDDLTRHERIPRFDQRVIKGGELVVGNTVRINAES